MQVTLYMYVSILYIYKLYFIYTTYTLYVRTYTLYIEMTLYIRNVIIMSQTANSLCERCIHKV